MKKLPNAVKWLIILVVLVQIIQAIFDLIARKIDKSK